MLTGDTRQAKEVTETLRPQHIMQVQHGVEVLTSQTLGLAHQPKEAMLLPAYIYSHRLDIVRGVQQELRQEGLGQEDELVLLVGSCHGVEHLYEHRYIAHGREADDEISSHVERFARDGDGGEARASDP